MPIGPGTRLGPYEIVSAIGAGGMGEVYRARDTRLQRDVAIKVLPELFAADPDRLARFEREAQLLASLNHPHIAAIYGLEETHDVGAGFSRPVRALILELVDGETLADRIARGPIPLDEALPIARQIAEALEAAHEQGIIHRDLKPANIKVTADGAVKVLDFGLAKLAESAGNAQPAAGVPPLSMSPTITSPAMMTGIGVLLGTAAYMSPEQAKGRPADKRSDIWAFGCALFEMLTGKRAFEGEDVSDTLAAVLRGEPDWNALPSDVSPRLRTVLKRCLERDRKARIPDIAAVRFLIDEAAAPAIAIGTPTTTHDRHRRNWIWQVSVAALALTTIAGATAWWFASRPAAITTTRFFVYPPEKNIFATDDRTVTSVAISPDGSKLAFTAKDASGKVLLWVRPIDTLIAQALPGTEDAAYPFWSPDSRFIAYFAPQKLLKISAGGGPPQILCTTAYAGNLRGGSWSADGTIIFSTGPGKSLSRVSSAGGQPSEFMRLPKAQAGGSNAGYVFPWFLPDGRHFLFYFFAVGSEDVQGIYIGTLDASDATRLVASDSAGVYDSRSRHILFASQSTLLAQPFDPNALVLTGESLPVAERVATGPFAGAADFSVSNTGVLVYGVGAGATSGLQMAWFDRRGRQVDAVGPAGNYRGIDLAPDGKRVAVHRHDGNGGDIWVTDLSRSATSRFTFDASQDNASPIWSPDGTRIVYSSVRNGKWVLLEKSANNAGAEEQLIQSDVATVPMSWSPKGGSILYQVNDRKTNQDLWVLPLSGDPKPFVLLDSPFQESHGQISPDGNWLAYLSNETGRNEVYVQPFPGGAGKWQVSTNGGVYPRWRHDGRELFYMSQVSGGKMMAVDVKTSGSSFEAGAPQELFDSTYVNLVHTGGNFHSFAVSPDGQRFLIPHPPSNDTANLMMPIVVVENWAAGITQ